MAATRRSPEGARLGWPGLVARWLPVGAVVGAVLSVAVVVAGFADWAELTWQLLQCATAATVFTALAFWGLTYAFHHYTEGAIPVERRRPVTEDEFWLARPVAAVMLVVLGVTLALTLAFVLGTGEWYSFAGY